jgi:hypothetical protein
MVCVTGVGIKEYFEGPRSWMAALRCPDPDCEQSPVEGHGGYRRYVGGVLRRIQRVRCVRCGVTHGVLPEEVCAYRDLTLSALERIWDASSPSAASRQVGEVSARMVRRMRRVLHRLRRRVSVEVRGWLPAVRNSGLRGLRQIFGSAPGVLLRLRRRLWSGQGLWFSGLCGLWRHGRPPHLDRRRAHKPW